MTQQTIDDAPPGEETVSPRPAAMTAATRYLSAGAYLDTTFRDRCLREVYYQDRRFTAPSYGFDLVTVLEHCLRARNLTAGRDASIVLTLVAATYLNWLSVAAVGTALVCQRVTGAAWRLARDFLARVRAGSAVDTTKSRSRGLLLLLGWAAAWIVFIVLLSKLGSAATTAFTGAAGMSSGAALLVAPAVLVLPLFFALWRQRRTEDFTFYGQPPPIRWTTRKRTIAEQQRGNTVVYAGYEPFIGAGEVVSSWGFAQRLVRKPAGLTFGTGEATEGEREFQTPPFTADEIVAYVRRHLRGLTTGGAAETSIPDLTVEDRIFQSAREDGPRTTVTGPDEMIEIIRNPTNPARHYLACQVVSWGGDVVTTVYVHIAVQGRSLYLEVASTSLAPCTERYRIVDSDAGTGLRAWLRSANWAIRDTPQTIVRAPARLVRTAIDMTGHGRGTSRGMTRRHKDYGARVSVRQMGTRDKLRNFTQGQDILKFRRLIESRVFAHVLDFLDEHDVDTSEVRTQRSVILNNSGILAGRDLNVNQGNVTNQAAAPAND